MLNYYVYAYLRADGTPYYIGKGKNKRAVAKDRWHKPPSEAQRIIILESNLSDVGALALERRYIRWYGRKNIGTGILRNLTDGGDGTSGAVRSTETKDKIRQARMGTSLSEETKAKISKANKGRVRTEETRAKISASSKLRDLSAEFKANMGSKPCSEETRAKLSVIFKGRILSEETKAKISKANKGRVRTEETKAKLRAAHAKRKLLNTAIDHKETDKV